MTSPDNKPPVNQYPGPGTQYPGPGTGRHRSDPTPPPGDDGARPEPRRFDGFTPRGRQAVPPPTNGNGPPGGGYRSLRQMSGTNQPSDSPAAPRATARPGVEEALRRLNGPSQPEEPSGWSRRRLTILGIVAAVVVLIIAVGGYAGYAFLSPYFKDPYKTGESVVVGSVKATVTQIKCDLHSAPFGNTGSPAGSYCGVVVAVHNGATGETAKTAWLNARSWKADLDVDLAVEPEVDFLPAFNEPVVPGATRSFRIVYDIPDASQVTDIAVILDEKTAKIPVS